MGEVDYWEAHGHEADKRPPVIRECRECEQRYTVPADKATSGSKWYALCPSCLRWHA
jgi:hypothetical protein